MVGTLTVEELLAEHTPSLVKAHRHWRRIEGDPYPYVRRALVTSAASWRRLRATQEIVSLSAHDPAAPDATDAVDERERMAEALATLMGLAPVAATC